MQPTIEQAAALAWDLVKADDDPPFSHCLKEHQDKLIYHAQDVQRGGPVSDAFEQKVKDVLADPEAAIADIKAKLGLPQVLFDPALIKPEDAAKLATPGKVVAVNVSPESVTIPIYTRPAMPSGKGDLVMVDEPLPDAPPTKPLAKPAKAKRGKAL